MRMIDLIEKKKKGGELSAQELHFLVQGFTKGTIPDYQMAAFAMAVCFCGDDASGNRRLDNGNGRERRTG